MSSYGDTSSEIGPGLGTEGGDEEMGESEGATDVEGGPAVKSEGAKFVISKELGSLKPIRVSFFYL